MLVCELRKFVELVNVTIGNHKTIIEYKKDSFLLRKKVHTFHPLLLFTCSFVFLSCKGQVNTSSLYAESTVTVIGSSENDDAQNKDEVLSLESTENDFVYTPPDITSQILYRRGYIVSYNQDTKLPNWVAWHLTAEHTEGEWERPSGNAFHADEEVPTPRAENDDYKGSGWSRGHMCPAGDNKWDETAMYESFSLVNVCPQNANLNSGLWNSIEIDCRKWARKFGDIFIVCGPLFLNQEHEVIGENKVVVPEAFFKVVLCLNGKPKALGIIVRNTDGARKRDIYYNSIDQVERITGMDFFPGLADDIENEVESEIDIDMWNY